MKVLKLEFAKNRVDQFAHMLLYGSGTTNLLSVSE